ncbi:hypothetical protein ACQEXU_10435 [Vibrio sp. TRT 21S02]|uniref:hypothetical protein n=1 Tax=Vibrio sp. TRT 21S02 TaxID=3418507 RepID=UPI003CF518B4
MLSVESKKVTKYDIFLLSFLILITLIDSSSISMLCQLLLLCKAVFVKKTDLTGIKELIIASLLGVEIVLIIFPILYFFSYIVFRNGRINQGYHKPYLFILIYAMIVAAYSSVSEFLPLNIIVWVLMFSTPFCYYFYAMEWNSNDNEKKKLLVFIELILLIEILCVFYQGITGIGFVPNDLFKGTLRDAHKLGLLFFIFVFYGCYLFKDTSYKIIGICIVILSLFVERWSDSKAILLSAAVASVIIVHLCVFYRKKFHVLLELREALFILTIGYFTLAYLILFKADVFNSVYDFFEPYVDGALTDSKYKMYVRVWHDIFIQHPFEWFFGTGPGTLASRASNMFSSDVLKAGNALSDYIISSSSWTRIYMDGLFTNEIIENIKWVSAVLTYPFSGFISLKGELGLLGLFLYISVIYKLSSPLLKNRSNEPISAFKLGLFISVFVFIVALLFDNYHEQLAISSIFFVLVGVFTNERTTDAQLENNYPN